MSTSLAKEVAAFIMHAYDTYLEDFNSITRRSKQRFENREWREIQSDSKDRLNLYKRRIAKITRQVTRMMEGEHANWEVWRQAKKHYAAECAKRKSYEIAETFYNSVCRKVIGKMGAHETLMFVEDEHKHREFEGESEVFNTYVLEDNFEEVASSILADFQFHAPFEDLARDLEFVRKAIWPALIKTHLDKGGTRFEVLNSVFYRNKAAYIVGRICMGDTYRPFVIPILHGENGMFVDTLILSPNDVSIIFSFTRSYFMVEVEIPSELIHFLRTLMPRKSYADLYASLGFSKHGKTELYRHFIRHLSMSSDSFIIAPGIKGMVMSVFTLPSYEVVFKLIKDKFDPPKTSTKGQVKSKYHLVKLHDRVGRMADTHEFEHFVLPRDRFSDDLLEELQQVAGSIVRVEGDKVIIDHLYTERKMTPLNIFLEHATEEEGEEVVGEYGNCIKHLAKANIFPGDMLLKNFGVTRHNRVVFYDYDEIGYLTDYKFRRLPEDDDDLYGREPWFAVGENDVFPEEFRHFLIGREDIREIFFRLHDDLFDPKFWIDKQNRIKAGEVMDFFPYRRKKRFRNVDT